jgi:hypothetical protein
MRKLFAHKQGLPGDRAPLVRGSPVVLALHAAATDALTPRHAVKGRLGKRGRPVRFDS